MSEKVSAWTSSNFNHVYFYSLIKTMDFPRDWVLMVISKNVILMNWKSFLAIKIQLLLLSCSTSRINFPLKFWNFQTKKTRANLPAILSRVNSKSKQIIQSLPLEPFVIPFSNLILFVDLNLPIFSKILLLYLIFRISKIVMHWLNNMPKIKI